MHPRYTSPEIERIWSIESQYLAWQRVEVAVSRAWHDKGLITAGDLKKIVDAPPVSPKEVLAREKVVKHDVIAFIETLSSPLGMAGRWIHYGMTSNDLVDTAQAIRIRESFEVIFTSLSRLIKVLIRLSVEHKRSLMIGRTHNVHALPVTFGLKCLLWFTECRRDIERLRKSAAGLMVGKISGPVGTYSETSPVIEKKALSYLGLKPAPVTNQVIQRDRHADAICSMAILASTLDKIAQELRLLQHTEISETEEPFTKGQRGSSAMPHKKNPVRLERISGLARIIRGYVVPALENISLWHERDISNSSAERIIFPDAFSLTHFIIEEMTDILKGLKVNKKRMAGNMSISNEIYFSESLLSELVRAGVERNKAYGWIQAAAMDAVKKNVSLRLTAKKNKNILGVLGDKCIDNCFKPDKLLKHIEKIYERCLKE